MVKARAFCVEHCRVIGRLAAYLLVVIMGAYGLFITNQNTDDIKRQAQTDQYLSCINSNETRDTLADLLAAAGTGTTPIDYTKIPSFADLLPQTQKFLIDYAAAIRANGNQTGLRDFIRDRLPQRDCIELFPEARH